MDCYDGLTDDDLEWLKNDFPENSQDEEWWEISQLEASLEKWGPEFEKDEEEESDYLNTHGQYFLYVFADRDYHLALFKVIDGNECFVSLDDNSKPFKTLGRLALTLDRFIQQYGGPYGGPGIVNKVPNDFDIRKYRSLYGFEELFLNDYLYGNAGGGESF